MHIGLAYDLRSEYLAMGYSAEETAEFDAETTIDALAATLRDLGHDVDRIGHIRSLARRLVAGDRWDLVFNICEGLHGIGREAQVPALLEAFGVPCTFSDPVVMGLSLHKALTKRVLRDAGIATAPFCLVERPGQTCAADLPYPLFAKPVAEGTGKGVTPASRIATPARLAEVCADLLDRYRQPVLVETYLPGREFTVGILGSGDDAEAIGALEIVLLPGAEAEVYSYANKERCEDLVEYRLVADDDARAAMDVGLRAWRAIGCRDGGRVDVRLDGHGVPHVLELNPLAGLHPTHSDLPILAERTGMGYRELVRRIVESAARRVTPRRAS